MPGGVAGLAQEAAAQQQAKPNPVQTAGPSVWDYITGIASNVGNRYAGFMYGANLSDRMASLGGNVAAEQSGVAQNAYQSDQMNKVFTPVQKALSFVGRIPTTGLILDNPSSQDSFAQGGWANLRDAWNDSTNVSPGQALLSSPQFNRPIIPFTDSDRSPFGGVKLDAYGGIDPTDPAIRQKAFQSGGVGQFASGATDALATWFLDPTVIGGKIAKAGIEVARGEKYLSDLERSQVHLEMDAQRAVANTGTAPISSSHIGDGLRDLYDNRADKVYLRAHPLLRAGDDAGALAEVMSGAQDFDEFATVYLAARRDPVAMMQLAAKAPSLADALERSRADLNNVVVSQYTIPKVGPDGQVTHDWELTQEQIATHTRIVQDMVARNQWLQRALGTADGTSGVYGTMTNRTFSPLPQVEEWRKTRAIQRAGMEGGVNPETLGYTTSTKYQSAGPGSPAVRVINWFGSDTPRGYVNVAGVGASDSIREVQATLREAKASPAEMRLWMDKYGAAATADQRQQVLEAMDNALGQRLIMDHLTANNVNVTPEMYQTAKKNAENWMTQYHVSRKRALEQYRESDNYMYNDVAHEWWKFQPLESYQSQLVPLTDFKELQNALKHMDQTGLELMTHKVLSNAEHVAGSLSYMWKAGVLLRIGAVPKNVLESQMASAVFLSRLAGDPVVGSARFVANRWDGVKQKFWNVGRVDTPESLADTLSVSKMRPQDVNDALTGKVQELEQLRSQLLTTMEENVRAGRREGSEAFYAQAPEHGVQVSHADIQTGVMQPAEEGKRTYLWGQTREEYRRLSGAFDEGAPLSKKDTARLRELHGRAARSYLREQQANGMEVVARKGGTYQPVDSLDDLTDLDLLPYKQDPSEFPANPDVFLTQRYRNVVKEAPSPKAVVSTAVGRRGFQPDMDATHLPSFDAVYEEERLADLRAAHDHITALDAQIDGVRKDLATLAASVRRPRRRAAGAEPETITGASGRTYSAQGADQGTAADIMRGNITSAHKNNLQMTAYDTERLQASSFNRQVRQTGGRTEYNPDDPLYYTAIADIVNTKIRNSPLAQRLLNGEDPAHVSDWLRTTTEGNDSLRALNMFNRDPAALDQFVNELNHNLRAMLPSDSLQQTILGLDRDITAKEVQAFLGKRDDLNPVVSEQWATDPLADPNHFVNRTIDKLYDKLWTVPEDRMARWPLYNHVYRASVQRDLQEWLPHLEKMSEYDANQIIKKVIEPAARRNGMRTVKRVIYSADRRTAPAEALRFLAPFYQVTANRTAYYGSQFLENPQNMARLFLTWNAIPTEKDANGNDVVVMPEWMAKIASFGTLSREIRFQKSYLNLYSSGDPWYSPGAGPLVTTPLAHVLRDNPNPPKWVMDLADKSGILPHGYLGQDDLSQFEPTWLRRIVASKGDQWASTYTMIYAQQMMLYKNHQRPNQPTNEEVTARTNQLWNFRIAAAFISPAQPDVSADASLTPAIELHRQYVQKYGDQADAMFLQDHPEMYDYVVSVSSNPTGIDPTRTAAEREDQNRELIASLEDKNMAGLITNLAGTSGGFDSQAYNWEYGRPVAPGSSTLIRGPRPGGGQDALDQRLVSRGWLEYTQAAKARDSILAAYGFKSINSSGAEWIKALFEFRKQQIIQDTTNVDMSDPSNPITTNPWLKAFGTQDETLYATRANTLQQIVGNKDYYNANLAAQPWLPAARQYLELRSKVAGMLAAIKAAGGSGTLSANSNSWLADLWDAQTTALRDSNPQWADIANRYFANDQVQVIPSG